MFHRFKNLDKKQKLELYKVLGYSICALIGGVGSAKQIGVDADLGDPILYLPNQRLHLSVLRYLHLQ